MALDFQGRHDQAWEEQKDEAELLADATDSECYDGGEFRERSEVVGGEQRQERGRGTATVTCLLARKRRKTLGGGSCVASAVSGNVKLNF